MTEILDRSRPYGTIVPPMAVTIDGGASAMAHYDQEGLLFGPDWRRIYREGETPEKPDPMAKARAAKKAKREGGEQDEAGNPVDAIYDKPRWRRNTPKATFSPKDGKGKRKYPRSVQNRVRPAASTRPAESVKPQGPNLTAWAMGTDKILFGTVRDAIRGRFNVVVSNEQDALEVLIREGVVAANDIPGYGRSTGPSIAGHAEAA